MVGTFWLLDIVVGSVSVALLLVLLFLYGRNLRQVRGPFAWGLFLFALLFLVENLVGIFAYLRMDAEGYGIDIALPMLYINIVEAAAFGVLVLISWD